MDLWVIVIFYVLWFCLVGYLIPLTLYRFQLDDKPRCPRGIFILIALLMLASYPGGISLLAQLATGMSSISGRGEAPWVEWNPQLTKFFFTYGWCALFLWIGALGLWIVFRGYSSSCPKMRLQVLILLLIVFICGMALDGYVFMIDSGFWHESGTRVIAKSTSPNKKFQILAGIEYNDHWPEHLVFLEPKSLLFARGILRTNYPYLDLDQWKKDDIYHTSFSLPYKMEWSENSKVVIVKVYSHPIFAYDFSKKNKLEMEYDENQTTKETLHDFAEKVKQLLAKHIKDKGSLKSDPR